jgi:hypothetical protein
VIGKERHPRDPLGDGFPAASCPDMNVWKIVKNTLPFFGTNRAHGINMRLFDGL